MNDTLRGVLQQQNNTLDSVFGLKNNGAGLNCLPCIYWLPKMHKIPCGANFMVAGKKCITKQLSKHVTSTFKPSYSKVRCVSQKKHIISVGSKPFG